MFTDLIENCNQRTNSTEENSNECSICMQHVDASECCSCLQNQKTCRSCARSDMKECLRKNEKPKCSTCEKPYLTTRVNWIFAKCCLFCVGSEEKEKAQCETGPSEPVATLQCGHQFCSECMGPYFLNKWTTNEEVLCPRCPYRIPIRDQQAIVSDLLRPPVQSSIKARKNLLERFRAYCLAMLSPQQDPWKWPCPECRSYIPLPLEAFVQRSDNHRFSSKCNHCNKNWLVIITIFIIIIISVIIQTL